MKNHCGYTYIEVLISIVISSFVVLTISTVSSISQRSYDKTMREAGIFSEISYGFKLMQNRVRSGKSLTKQSASGQWVSEQLIISNKEAFGLYRPTGSATIDLVYLKDKSQTNSREVILSVPTSDSVSFNVTINGNSATVRVNGIKKSSAFDMSTVMVRRS
jgi:type II secretory pathway component PulJ